MTGFARANGHDESFDWTWEIKSVNGKTLDVRCRFPPGLDRLEPAVRKAVSARVRRGNVTVNLQLSRASSTSPMRVNRAWLDELISIAGAYRDANGIDPPRLDGLLGLRGVIEPAEEEEGEDERARREAAMMATLEAALDGLVETRRAEGQKLGEILGARIDEITDLVSRADRASADRADALRARLRAQIDTLLDAGASVPEERLAQELALLATKLDIREELDRLKAHQDAARHHLGEAGPVGRKLDFLSQEFNREANTLCSKASDVELTKIGLALKAVIDQFREQVQNIE